MDILTYINSFIVSVKEFLQTFDDHHRIDEVPFEYDEEVELIWLASQGQY